MEYVEVSPFISFWHQSMIIGAIVAATAGIVWYLLYQIRVSSIADYHLKYEFINANEIRNLKVMAYCFGVATGMLINLYASDKMKDVQVWFFARLAMSIFGGTLVGYVGHLIFEYYYPTILHKKLLKWRYTPRRNPKTGNTMRLLSEEEEDVHLESGMQAEENMFSIDYDVWVDEKTGDVKIEKYRGHLEALQCNNCGFYTMKVQREEITKPATAEESGELVKYYECTYCKSNRATAFNLSNKQTESDYKNLKYKFRQNKDIDLVKLEIHSTVKGKKQYEFQNIEEAQKFLTEFDFDKSDKRHEV
ncbi:MAG: hypothetical protein O9302_03580 [Cyclobacteriaceae bacterium]|jgi:hypothetical protein|nr:hypothetical protein [Flammeovirgaceae bacterium]MCZ8020271.1 hypothetical protein [Cytophagales bacterium]MCZ8327117.1 hypothetical protein [Cyclobacteriaceae bacterium]